MKIYKHNYNNIAYICTRSNLVHQKQSQKFRCDKNFIDLLKIVSAKVSCYTVHLIQCWLKMKKEKKKFS